jgi:hypothetical protein
MTQHPHDAHDPARDRAPIDGAGDRVAAACERRLVLAAKDGADVERAALVLAFAPRIGSVADMYHAHPQIDRDELTQAGAAGLLRALERFDPALGTPFWMYASWWVRQAMEHFVWGLGGTVVLSPEEPARGDGEAGAEGVGEIASALSSRLRGRA